MTGSQRPIGPLTQQRSPAVRLHLRWAIRNRGLKQFARQILRQHLLAGGHDGEPATGVFQLTDVAWPRQAGQRCLRFRMQLFGFNAELAGGYLQKMAGQAWNIFPALAQHGKCTG